MNQTPPRGTKREAIVEAARLRFRNTGVEETTLEMIAEDVGIARPNLYRYFRSKSELVTAIIGREAAVFNQQRWAQTRRLRSFSARIVKSLQLAAQLVHDDPLWSALNSPSGVPYTAQATTTDPQAIEANREYWLPILESARAKNELKAGLEFEDVMHWLLGLEFLFMERRELFPDDQSIKSYVSRFVVPALVDDGG